MNQTNTYKAKRLGDGRYLYRGYVIHTVGYHSPEHRICWEAMDENGCAFAHSFSMRECKKWVDREIERIQK